MGSPEFGKKKSFISLGCPRFHSKERDNENKSSQKQQKSSIGKVVTGALLGSVVRATVGWLTAPTSGEELRRRIKGEVKGVREKAKTAAGNIETKARKLAAEVNENVDNVKASAPPAGKLPLSEVSNS